MTDNKPTQEDITNTMRSLLKQHPDMLLEASKTLYAEFMVESITTGLDPKANKKKLLHLQVCGAICQQIGTFLVRSGLAQLSQEAITGAMVFMSMMNRKD